MEEREVWSTLFHRSDASSLIQAPPGNPSSATIAGDERTLGLETSYPILVRTSIPPSPFLSDGVSHWRGGGTAEPRRKKLRLALRLCRPHSTVGGDKDGRKRNAALIGNINSSF